MITLRREMERPLLSTTLIRSLTNLQPRHLHSALVIATLLVGAIGCTNPESNRPPADRVILGTIHTVNSSNTIDNGIAITNGLIVAVGSEAEIRDYIGENTLVTELGDRALIPGFVDGHSHLQMTGDTSTFTVNLTSPPVGSLTTIDEVVAALKTQADQAAPGEWVVGFGYDDTLLSELRHPTREDLDRASSTLPILAFHVSGHLAVANSRALELGGITQDTAQPPGGRIRKDASGQPNGVLEEGSAFGRVFVQIPPRTDQERSTALSTAIGIYAAAGITTAQNGLTTIPALNDLAKLDASSAMPIRVVAWPDLVASQTMLRGEATFPTDTENLRIGATKITADGSIQGYTGFLGEPYHAAFQGDPEYRGYPIQSREALTEAVLELWENGRQIAIHGNGDAAIDDILYAYGQAQDRFGDATQRRPIIIHAQMTRPDQIETMAQLGVVPSFFQLHTYYWGDRHRDIFMGPERAARMSPTKSALDAGLHFTVHADTPVVPMEPVRMLWAAVNRTTSNGHSLGPEERLTVQQALRALTIEGAYQHFLETEIGSLEVGKKADFVVLSRDPLAVEPTALDQLEVLETVVGGTTVFSR